MNQQQAIAEAYMRAWWRIDRWFTGIREDEPISGERARRVMLEELNHELQKLGDGHSLSAD